MSRPPIPGTHEPGFMEKPIVQVALPLGARSHIEKEGVRGIKHFVMGECSIILAREPAGPEREMLWHMSISCVDRHPTWDEMKTARYRLLPHSLCFGIMLPPPDYYVNIEAQDHVFHLWEMTDPRSPWEAM